LKRALNWPDCVVEKYDDEKNFQYVSCIGEVAEIYLPKEQYNVSMLIPSLNPLGMVCKIQLWTIIIWFYKKNLKKNGDTVHKTGEKSAHLYFAIPTTTQGGYNNFDFIGQH
jgi:hypothetical protein